MTAAKSAVIETAKDLYDLGIFVVPIVPGTKLPPLDGWNELRLTHTDFPKYFTNGQGIGALLGIFPAFIIDLDFDDPLALRIAHEKLIPNQPPTRWVFGRKSNPCSHYIYRFPGEYKPVEFVDDVDPVANEKRGEKQGHVLLELRGTKVMTVFPPTIHKSGEPIEWANSPTRENLGEANDGTLYPWAARVATATLLARHYPVFGKGHKFALALSGWLGLAGWNESAVVTLILAAATAAKDPELDERRRNVRSTFDNLAEGRKNLEQRKHLEELLGENGKKICAKVAEWLGLKEKTEKVSVEPLVIYEGNDFLTAEFPTREPLVKLAKSDTVVFYARSLNQIYAWRGTGKSMVAFGLSSCFCHGGKFLNLEATRPAKVLYIEGEMPDDQLQDRARNLIGKAEQGFFRIITLDGQPNGITPLSTAAGRKAIEDAIGDAEVLILDSLSTLAWISTNDEENWLELLAWFNMLRKRGLCVIFLHHAGKSGMQRGHSRSEDMLDISIKLTTNENAIGCGYLSVNWEYDKFRHLQKGIRSLLVEYKEARWLWTILETEKIKLLADYLRDNPKASSRAVAKALPELGNYRTIQRLMKKSAPEPQPVNQASLAIPEGDL